MNILLASATSLISVIVIYLINWRSKSPRIPGPPPHPFVGHTFQVPTIKSWKYFEKLWRQYGSIVKVTLAGDDMIILSNPSDAEELASIHHLSRLARRARNYSSRRPLIYAGKYESNNLRLSLLPYGDMLKRQRAAFHQMLQPRAIGGYEEMQHLESLRLLVDLVKTPAMYYNHVQRFPASLIFNLTFGRPLNDDGKDLATAIEIFIGFVKDITPGAHLVDTFPMLDLLPDFLSPWRAEAKLKHKREFELYSRLSLEVKAKMEKDPEMECFAARLWEQQKKLNIPDEELFYIAGSAFVAGTDTSSLTLLWFLMAMALYPATMQKAQKEIDSVFNSDSLPNFSGIPNLPYCAALIKEVLRWGPAAPLSLPHYTTADDEYQGYTIRKGTMVISSIWNMHHNEDEFPNSYAFDPDRWLSKEPGAGDTADSLGQGHYGFGVRKCPGHHLATKSTWIAVVRVLWAFNIEPAKDISGKPMKIDPEDCTSGLTSRPREFPVNFVPRSATHVETIISTEELA
ncbi:cytochrome P450 [Mycena olivaceomarginata]|nr:cytochrome P450 [Mycena olivaceomarginata]